MAVGARRERRQRSVEAEKPGGRLIVRDQCSIPGVHEWCCCAARVDAGGAAPEWNSIQAGTLMTVDSTHFHQKIVHLYTKKEAISYWAQMFIKRKILDTNVPKFLQTISLKSISGLKKWKE